MRPCGDELMKPTHAFESAAITINLPTLVVQLIFTPLTFVYYVSYVCILCCVLVGHDDMTTTT